MQTVITQTLQIKCEQEFISTNKQIHTIFVFLGLCYLTMTNLIQILTDFDLGSEFLVCLKMQMLILIGNLYKR